jgi:hypothetical protein
LQQIRAELKRREDAARNGHLVAEDGETGDGSVQGTPRRNESGGGGNQEQGPLQALITNVLIGVCVVLFGLVVKYVVTLSNTN